MKPQELENKRYREKDHCKIMLEEEQMFNLLDNWSRRSGKNKKDIKIMDLGCGSGLITKKIQDLGYEIAGLDFSEEAVKKALANGIDAKVCNLDEGISAESDTFDVVWAGDIIEHVFDPIGLLKEINRILKKRGAVILSTPNDVGLITRLKILMGISHQEITYKKYGYYKHHTFFTLDLIKYMLRKNNLAISKIVKILNTGKKRFSFRYLPSFLYNELVILADKE